MGVESNLSERPLKERGLSFRRRPSGYASPRLLISFIPIESKESLTKHNKNVSGLTLVKPCFETIGAGYSTLWHGFRLLSSPHARPRSRGFLTRAPLVRPPRTALATMPALTRGHGSLLRRTVCRCRRSRRTLPLVTRMLGEGLVRLCYHCLP
jgi:hypothetical protein